MPYLHASSTFTKPQARQVFTNREHLSGNFAKRIPTIVGSVHLT